MSSGVVLKKALYRMDEVCFLLSYGKTKVKELLNDGKLQAVSDTGNRSKALRVTAVSINKFINDNIIDVDTLRE